MADLTNVDWSEFPVDAEPEDRVSADFKFYELTSSETAARQGIDNSFPSPVEARAAVFLCRQVMQPVRDHFDVPMTPNSVYRSQALDRALKGMPTDWVSPSQHTLGQACDIEVPGVSNRELAAWVIGSLAFDQIILECYDAAKGPNSGWVHVSLRPPGTQTNRREILSYVRDPRTGKYVYVRRLRESPE